MVFQLFQLTLKLLVLLSQLNILSDFWIDIFSWNVANIGGHTCICQCLKRLFEVGHRRVKTCNHQAVRITTYRLLEKSSQLAVSVRWK